MTRNAFIVLMVCSMSACAREPNHAAEQGARIIREQGCGGCHTIPGIRGANGVVGPPLYFFSRRVYIAGEIPNTFDNLVRWVRDPKSIEEKTAMPTIGLTEEQARDVAAYLYTLR